MTTYNSVPTLPLANQSVPSWTPSRPSFGNRVVVTLGLLVLSALCFVFAPHGNDVYSVKNHLWNKVSDITTIPMSGSTDYLVDADYTSIMRADTGAVEYLTPTGDCGAGLYCRAVLLFTIEHDKAIVSAGYAIRPRTADTKTVDSKTKERISAVTLDEAMVWAGKLLKAGAVEIEEYGISVSQEDIAEAILKMAVSYAAVCETAGDGLCDGVEMVQEVPLVESMDGWVFRLYNVRYNPHHLCIYSSSKSLGTVGGGVLWPDQSWKFESADGGYYIRNNLVTDYYISLAGIRAVAKTGPISKEFVWSVDKFENGTMIIRNVATSGYLLLYRPGNVFAPDWGLDVLKMRFGTMLEWTMDVLSKPSDESLEGEKVVIRSEFAPTTVLKVFEAGAAVGTIAGSESEDAQWNVEATGKGEHTYYIKNVKYPEVWMQREGTNVMAGEGIDGDQAFMWRVNKKEDGFYVIATYMRPDQHITYISEGASGAILSGGGGTYAGKDEWGFEKTA